jgi:hypothetical protein
MKVKASSGLKQSSKTALFNRWTPEERRAQVSNAVTGAASQLPIAYLELTYAEHMDKLRQQYGSQEQRDQFRHELLVQRRQPNEGLRSLADDVERLTRLAYPDMSTDVRDRDFTVQRFLDAFENSEFSFEVSLREPKTLNKALNEAVRIQAFLKVRSERGRKNVRYFQDAVSYDDAAGQPRARKSEKRQASLPKEATVSDVRKSSIEHTQELQTLLAENKRLVEKQLQ